LGLLPLTYGTEPGHERLFLQGQGLHSISGAEEIITHLRQFPDAMALDVSYNDLGDDGGVALFEYLVSPDGRKLRLEVLECTSCMLGDRSFALIARLIGGNRFLRQLRFSNVSRARRPCVSAAHASPRINLEVPHLPQPI
jgi:hypothetical protein